MFHISNLGSFGDSLKKFSDLEGYVPEEGDDHEEMSWDSRTEWDDDFWEDFVSEAVDATEEANKAVADWQSENA